MLLTLTVLFYSIVSVLIFLFAGFGLTVLFCPRGLRKYVLFLSPVVGYCYLALAGWHLSTFGMEIVFKGIFNGQKYISAVNPVSSVIFRGTDSYAWLILLPPVVFLAGALYRNRVRFREAAGMTDIKGLIAPLAVAISTFILLSVPMFRYGDGLTTVCPGNHDIIDSGIKSRFLQEFSLSDTQGFVGAINKDGYSYLKHDILTNRFGTPFAAAFLSSIFSLEAYQFQTLITTLMFFFGMLLFYILVREVFKFDGFPSLLTTALYGLSPVIYYLTYQGFQPQIAGMALATGFFLIQFHAVENSSKFSDFAAYIPLLAFINWGINISYAHMLPIIYAPVAAYVVIRAVYDRSFIRAARLISRWTGIQALALMLTSALSLFRMKTLIGNLIAHAGTESGWDMPYFFPDFIMGFNYVDTLPELSVLGYLPFFKPLFSFGKYLSSSTEMYIHYAVSAPIVIALGIGLVRVFRKDRRVFLISIACLATVIGGYNFIYFVTELSAKYKSFKLASFFLPLVFPVFLLALRDFRLRAKRFISVSFVLALIVANLISAVVFLGHSFEGRYVGQELADIKKIEAMPQVDSVNILGFDWWQAMWKGVFLMKKVQYYQNCFYSMSCTDGIIDGKWDLWNMKEDGIPPEGCRGDIMPVNSTYVLMSSRRLAGDAMRSELELKGSLDYLKVGYKVSVPVRVKNISRHRWDISCDPVRRLYLSYRWYKIVGGRQESKGMGGTPLPKDLGPGEEVVVDLPVKAPSETGRYTLVIDILQETVLWFADRGSRPLYLDIDI